MRALYSFRFVSFEAFPPVSFGAFLRLAPLNFTAPDRKSLFSPVVPRREIPGDRPESQASGGYLVKTREDARFIFENKQQVHRLTEEVRRVSVQCYRLRQKNKTLERILRRMVDLLRGSSPADLAAARVEAERIQRTI